MHYKYRMLVRLFIIFSVLFLLTILVGNLQVKNFSGCIEAHSNFSKKELWKEIKNPKNVYKGFLNGEKKIIDENRIDILEWEQKFWDRFDAHIKRLRKENYKSAVFVIDVPFLSFNSSISFEMIKAEGDKGYNVNICENSTINSLFVRLVVLFLGGRNYFISQMQSKLGYLE